MKIGCISFSPTDSILFNTEITTSDSAEFQESSQLGTEDVDSVHCEGTQFEHPVRNSAKVWEDGSSKCDISWYLLKLYWGAAAWTLCSVPWNKWHNSLRKKAKDNNRAVPSRGVSWFFIKIITQIQPPGWEGCPFPCCSCLRGGR